MIAALALLVGAVLAGGLAPAALRRLDVRRRDPVPLIVAWLLSMAGVLLATVAGIGLLFLPDHGLGGAMITGAHGCWSAVRHGSPPRTEELAGASGTLLTLAVAARFGFLGRREGRHRARVRAEHVAMLRLAARMDDTSPTTLWLAHDRPLAFSLAGRPGVVVATEGLARRLRADEVAAVLAHERAHLRGHHHVLVTIADVLGAVFSFLRLFGEAPVAMRELVEIAADLVAVRSCGVDAVRSALAMGSDAVDVRLARLGRTAGTPNRVCRAFVCMVAGTVAVLLPFLAGVGLLLAVVTVTCPLTG